MVLEVRDTDTFERLVVHILHELEEDALATDHEMAQNLDIEQSQGADEKFKESRYRKKRKTSSCLMKPTLDT